MIVIMIFQRYYIICDLKTSVRSLTACSHCSMNSLFLIFRKPLASDYCFNVLCFQKLT